MSNTAESSGSPRRNKCSACFRQYNKKEHLVEHMRSSYHSQHEPTCGICKKHCRSFDSLREHLIGPLPKVECAKAFEVRGCRLCLSILDTQTAIRMHRTTCQLSPAPPGTFHQVCKLSIDTPSGNEMNSRRSETPKAVAMSCKMVGGGSDGSLDICGRVCIINEDENIIFHTFVKPQIPITNYRYEKTGISAEYIRDAMPIKQVQRQIQDFLCNGEALWKICMIGGRTGRILVGHGLDRDLQSLGIEYPLHSRRDTAKYPPLMKTSKFSNSLKHLAKTYLGYEIQNGIQDPYEDCVALMRLYARMRSQTHVVVVDDYWMNGEAQHRENFATSKQKDLERMTPDALLEKSRSDYYCWCLDTKRVSSSSSIQSY